MKHALTLLAALAILSLPLIGRAEEAAPDAVALRLHLQPGDKYAITTTTEKTKGQWFQDAESTETTTTTMWLTMEVLSVEEDGTATVKLTYDRIVFKAQSALGSIEYDSQNKNEDVEFPGSLYQALVGRSFRAKLSPTGTVLKVLDVHAICGAVRDAMPEGRTVKIMSPAGLDATNLINPRHLDDLVASLFLACPDEPLAVGGTWTREEKPAGNPPVSCNATYKLVSRADGVATIQAEGTAKHNPNVGLGGATVFTNVEGELGGTRKGTVTLDEASGMIIEGRITTALEGEMNFKMIVISNDDDGDADDPQEETSKPMTIDITTTVKCKKQP
jgi:hypothetical protein